MDHPIIAFEVARQVVCADVDQDFDTQEKIGSVSRSSYTGAEGWWLGYLGAKRDVLGLELLEERRGMTHLVRATP